MSAYRESSAPSAPKVEPVDPPWVLWIVANDEGEIMAIRKSEEDAVSFVNHWYGQWPVELRLFTYGMKAEWALEQSGGGVGEK